MPEPSNRVVYWGTGRRKTSVARVRLVPGSGRASINDTTAEQYFDRDPGHLGAIKAPLETLGLEGDYDIRARAHGGGKTGQAEAVKLGVARALCKLAPENRDPLKVEGHLTRDPRSKERKKYGLRKARKSPQYSKR
ncbi:MAG: 30S ribosomal protein S9 [Cyanobacteria bacterium QS_8_64_29]|nr:MAG: 30S ribosomal protein S9 [Cyanobacteria bacterium QS_8_64_29]